MKFADTSTNDRVRTLVLAFLDEIAIADPGSATTEGGKAALHASTAAQVILEGLMLRHKAEPLMLFQGFGVGIGVDLAKFEDGMAAGRAVDLIPAGLDYGLTLGAEALAPKGRA